MKNIPIAVIGGGAVGKTFACDSVLGGNTDVRLYGRNIFAGLDEQQRQTLPLTIYGPQKNSRNYCREGSARPQLITDQLPLAMAGAKVVIVALPSSAHPSLFRHLIPCLEDGMIVHIMPDNYGALRLRKMMCEAGCEKRVVVGGWNLPPFGARLRGKQGTDAYSLRMVNRFMKVTGAAFPYTDQQFFMESIRSLAAFDCLLENDGVSDGDTILDADFGNLNAVLHIPTTILGVGVMENWGKIYGTPNEFSIFCHAMCPSIAKVQKQFYDEEIAVAKALGVTIREFGEEWFYNRESVLAATYLDKDDCSSFDDPCPHQLGIGPPSIRHRFITEDVPMSAMVIHHLGVLAGVSTPLIDAFITIAGTMVDQNYFSSGTTLADIGLSGLRRSNLRSFLEQGTV